MKRPQGNFMRKILKKKKKKKKKHTIVVIENVYSSKGNLMHYCTTIPRYPVFSARYSVICKVYTGYHGKSQIEHGLCACTVDNPLAKARGLSLRTGTQNMRYLSLRDFLAVVVFQLFQI